MNCVIFGFNEIGKIYYDCIYNETTTKCHGQKYYINVHELEPSENVPI